MSNDTETLELRQSDAPPVREDKNYKRDLTLKEFNKVYVSKMKMLMGVVPSHMSADRAWRLVYTAFDKTPALKQCSIQSIIDSVINAVSVGLEFNTALGHGYLIPYKGKCKFIPGYRGLIYLAMNSPNIVGIDVDLVHQNDACTFEKGSTPRLTHTPLMSGDRGEWDFGYACIYHAQGPPRVFVMRRDEIHKQYEAAKAKMPDWKFKRSPWCTDYNEMAKKTIAKRSLKLEPLSAEYHRAENLEYAVEEDQPQPTHVGPEDFKTIEAERVVEGEEAASLPDGSKEDARMVAARKLAERVDSMIDAFGIEKKRLGETAYHAILSTYGARRANDPAFMTKDENDVWRGSIESQRCWIELNEAADAMEKASKKRKPQDVTPAHVAALAEQKGM